MDKIIERQQAMNQLRQAVKQSPYTYGDIAHKSGNSPNWIGTVLRGGYPYCGAYLLPGNIRMALQIFGFDIPEILITW